MKKEWIELMQYAKSLGFSKKEILEALTKLEEGNTNAKRLSNRSRENRLSN